MIVTTSILKAWLGFSDPVHTESIEKLLGALQGFSGTLLWVTHVLWSLRGLMEGLDDDDMTKDMGEKGR